MTKKLLTISETASILSKEIPHIESMLENGELYYKYENETYLIPAEQLNEYSKNPATK